MGTVIFDRPRAAPAPTRAAAATPLLRRLLSALLLLAPLGGARAYCGCGGATVCGPTDLVLVADEYDTIDATSCVPDAAGHLEADIRIFHNDALTSLELPPALSSVGGYLEVSYNDALTSLAVLRVRATISKRH